jgi:hypothetical protein
MSKTFALAAGTSSPPKSLGASFASGSFAARSRRACSSAFAAILPSKYAAPNW